MRLPSPLHRWNVTPKQAIEIQRTLVDRIVYEPLPPVRWVAGADMAFTPDEHRCVAGVVVWDRQTGLVVEEQTAVRAVRFPYVPGLLTFREAPAVLAAIRKLRRTPDVLILDGQGRAHPRRMGLASHVGLLAGVPTVGCAKSRLCGTFVDPAPARGSRADLMDEDEIIGAVVRTRADTRCVFVSVGHRVTLDDAVSLVLACCTRYRLPEPTRLAHQLVTRRRNEV